MSSRKVNLDSVLRYAKRINKMSKRRIDFGEAITNKTTKSHAELLQIKRLLNDAENRFERREQDSAKNQFLSVVVYNTMKKTGSKKLSFSAFKQAVANSNLDKLTKSAENKPADKKSDNPAKSKSNSSNNAANKNVPKSHTGTGKSGQKDKGKNPSGGLFGDN